MDTLATKPLDRPSSEQQQKLGIHLAIQHYTALACTAITNYGLIETYPTESRMRQKAEEQQLKDAGQTVARKRRVKFVEKGSDDMGECIDTLPVDDAADAYYDGGLSGDQPHEHVDCADPEMELVLSSIEADLTPYHWLYGAESDGATTTTGAARHDTMETFLVHWSREQNDKEFVDVAEIGGGSARTSHVLIKRWHTVQVGLNFDMTVSFDLLKPKDVQYMWIYLRTARPLVVVIATPCTGLAGFAGISAARGSPMHFENLEISTRLGTLGGEIAVWQLQGGRHFLTENPAGSQLYKLPVYLVIARYPQVIRRIIHVYGRYARLCSAAFANTQVDGAVGL